jgi:hypothetical protein
VARPDRVTVNFKTERFDRFSQALLVGMLGRGRLTRKALRQVAEGQLLPKVRSRTPVGETGEAQAGWKIGREGETSRGRPFVELINAVFYIRFLEFGTLAARKKKLRKTTERRLRQKQAKGGYRLSREGGIRPIRMLGTSMRDLRAAKAVPKALAAMVSTAAVRAKREAESVRV